MFRSLLLSALLSLPGASLLAQAQPDCPMRPPTLSTMRGCYRPLLVFAPAGSDPRVVAQRDALDQAADDMMDRFVLLVPVLAKSSPFAPPLDAPYIVLPREEQSAIRRNYGVPPDRFEVLLIGEDGTVKLHAEAPVTVDRLNSLIDRMPTRKLEMQRPHAN